MDRWECHRRLPGARATVINQVIGRNAVAQLLAGVRKQRVIYGISAVLNPFNTLGYRRVCGIISICIGSTRPSSSPHPNFALRSLEIEDGANFIPVYEGQLIARRVDRDLPPQTYGRGVRVSQQIPLAVAQHLDLCTLPSGAVSLRTIF